MIGSALSGLPLHVLAADHPTEPVRIGALIPRPESPIENVKGTPAGEGFIAALDEVSCRREPPRGSIRYTNVAANPGLRGNRLLTQYLVGHYCYVI